MADLCGAKTRSGGKCRKAPIAGKKRCRLHGGASTGAPKGNQSAAKHGIYGDLIRPDELGHVESMLSAAGVVAHELLIARLQLRRALKAQAAADDIEDGMEVYEIIDREGAENVTARSEVKKKQRDYPQIIDRILARIESLEKTRAALLADGSTPTDDMTREDTFIKPDEPVPNAPIL